VQRGAAPYLVRVGPHVVLHACIASHGRLLDALAGLSNDDLAAPSRLPGWTRGHVVTHLARKSCSHVPLFEGALADEVRVQDLGADHEAEVAKGASRPAAALHADLRQSFAVLEEAWRSLPEELWGRQAITTGGRRSVAEVVERHLRDVEVHHVDLGIGYEPEDWPEEFLDVELPKRLAGLPGRATAPQLLAWLLGRAPAPELGPW
jgi:maleylpyruvate isomerase